MKPGLVDKGAGRYVVGNAERFDQKNYMFKRGWWDPKWQDAGRRHYIERWDGAELLRKNKLGYTLKDAAFEDAAWRLELEFAKGIQIGNQGFYAWDTKGIGFMRLPPGVRLTVDDPTKMTSDVKKVAKFFGASLVGVCELDKRWLYSNYYDSALQESGPVEILDMAAVYTRPVVTGFEVKIQHHASVAPRAGLASQRFGRSLFGSLA